MDVTRNPSVQGEYGVEGFPTLRWFVNGKPSRLIVEARSAEALVAFCKRNSDGGAVGSAEQLVKHIEEHPVVVVAYLHDEV